MTDSKKTDAPSELSGDDLDMAVGGAAKTDLSVTKAEQQIKLKAPAEEHRKKGSTAREEKIKHQ